MWASLQSDFPSDLRRPANPELAIVGMVAEWTNPQLRLHVRVSDSSSQHRVRIDCNNACLDSDAIFVRCYYVKVMSRLVIQRICFDRRFECDARIRSPETSCVFSVLFTP